MGSSCVAPISARFQIVGVGAGTTVRDGPPTTRCPEPTGNSGPMVKGRFEQGVFGDSRALLHTLALFQHRQTTVKSHFRNLPLATAHHHPVPRSSPQGLSNYGQKCYYS